MTHENVVSNHGHLANRLVLSRVQYLRDQDWIHLTSQELN